MDDALHNELLAMRQTDLEMRRRLIDAGELYGSHLPKDWYHPEMAKIHRRNSARMRAILTQRGYPGYALVGMDGEDAAWMILQHAILDLDLQEAGLILLEAAVKAGDAP